jgi:Asp/Glu/hydantoin racemase
VNPDLALFSRYMALTGTPSLDAPIAADPALQGKRLGIVNGSNWISLFATYFGRQILPGVQLVQAGNEAVQLNFMQAHRAGLPCPPQVNIDLVVRYSEELVQMYGVDAILISCSTMNRAAAAVREAMGRHRVPVVQIDEAMMERAVERGGRILVIATHGPTVRNTQELLRETAAWMGRRVEFEGATVEEAFHLLGRGEVEAHNELIAGAIREAAARTAIDTVVLAQLSMAVFELSYPDPVAVFGMPVLSSGRTGFERVREVLSTMKGNAAT